jgi:hypothetical protein
MKVHKAFRARRVARTLSVFALCVGGWVCATRAAGQTSQSGSAQPRNTSPAKSAPNAAAPAKASPFANIKLKAFDQIDHQLNMVAMRLAIPEEWRGQAAMHWDAGHFYMPVNGNMRAQAPDGSSWVEFYQTVMFVWFDPVSERTYRQPLGALAPSGAYHHPNVGLPEALARYVIAPNRRNVRNARVVGYRPVDNLPAAFPHVFTDGAPPPGQSICMRLQYELDGVPVEEEFYGFMPRPDAIPGPAGTEYHSYILLPHSVGAKSGKLESVRPLLGTIATSLARNPQWLKVSGQLRKSINQQVAESIAGGGGGVNSSVEMAKRISAQTHAKNEAFLANSAKWRATNLAPSPVRAPSYGGGSGGVYPSGATPDTLGSDGFDQYVRGTQHMMDQNGVVSDQTSGYNYHWTDGNSTFVHTNDGTFDPNSVFNRSFEQMRPVQ